MHEIHSPRVAEPHSPARLLIRLYRRADEARRSRMLTRLLQPLGLLSLTAVAAGAFRPLLGPQGLVADAITPASVSGYSTGQVFELVSFVHDMDPQLLWQAAVVLVDTPWALPSFTLAVLVLLRRRVLPRSVIERLAPAAPVRPAA